MNYIEMLSTILGSGALAAAGSAWFNRKKVAADATAVTVEAVLRWANMLTERINMLEKKVDERDAVIIKLNVDIHSMRTELNALKHTRSA